MEPEIDLLLIGHAVEDWIFEDDKEPRQQFGGIYNVARSFKKVTTGYWGYPPPKIAIEPSAYGHAFVKIDRQNATKDVCASLNDKSRKPTLHSSEWTHYCYLNQLENFDILAQKVGIVSADLCKGWANRFHYKYFDYIFLSSDEHDPESQSKGVEDVIFIAHSPERVEIWENGQKLWQSKPIEQIKDTCVLGVGDHFAASFIVDKLYNGAKDEDAANFAIARCRDYLLYN